MHGAARRCYKAEGSPGVPEVPGLGHWRKRPISAPRARLVPGTASSFLLVTAEENETKRARTEAGACLLASRSPGAQQFLALSCFSRNLA